MAELFDSSGDLSWEDRLTLSLKGKVKKCCSSSGFHLFPFCFKLFSFTSFFNTEFQLKNIYSPVYFYFIYTMYLVSLKKII